MPPVFWKNANRQKLVEKLGFTPEQYAVLNRIIVALETNPYPDGCKKLKGKLDGLYRIRLFGNFRLIYKVERDAVTLIDIDDRKDAYR